MPKKIERPKDKYKLFVVLRIEHACENLSIDKEHQRLIARVSPGTYNRRRRDPGKFTLDELRRFANRLGVSVWDFINPNYKM